MERHYSPKRYVSDRLEHNKYNERQNDVRRTGRHYDQLAYSPINLKKEYKYTDAKKFTYLEENKPATMVVALSEADLLKRIRELEYYLENEQMKYKQLEERTIDSQRYMLYQLNTFEEKFEKLRQEKRNSDEYIRLLRTTNNLCADTNIFSDYKKIKGIASALIDMRSKVEGQDGDLKQAWKWVKDIVAQHEATQKYVYKWRQAYEQLYGRESYPDS